MSKKNSCIIITDINIQQHRNYKGPSVRVRELKVACGNKSTGG